MGDLFRHNGFLLEVNASRWPTGEDRYKRVDIGDDVAMPTGWQSFPGCEVRDSDRNRLCSRSDRNGICGNKHSSMRPLDIDSSRRRSDV